MSRNWRIYLVIFCLLITGAAIMSRLFLLQVVNSGYYQKIAERQHSVKKEIENERGVIYAKDRSELFPVAVNRKWPMVYLVPKDIKEDEKDGIISKLSAILLIDEEVIKQKIEKKDDPYEPLSHRLNEDDVGKIKNLGFSGVRIINENLRYYPLDDFMAHIIGFLGFSGDKRIGQYGIEEFYEKELRGEDGQIVAEKDALGRIIEFAESIINPVIPSKDIVLTVDKNIQFMAEEKLSQLIEEWEAESGNIIIMDPSTGSIIAMANWPTFNLNEYFKVENIDVFSNSSISGLFEPGSIFKPITMAAAVDDYKVSPNTVYFDNGFVKIGKYTIRNSNNKSYGEQTMTQVLEKSLNTGTIFAVNLMDKDDFLKYIRLFGFNKKTQIDLSGEVSGNISNLYFGKDVNYATASFGQGIAVTPIEMISAISAIANDGVMMKPRVVEGFRDQRGNIIPNEPEKLERVISSETAGVLTNMLINVVDNGSGKLAKIPGYYIAGKTGTAQISSDDEEGYGEDVIHAFVGYAPAFDPRFVILIKIDKPKGIKFAANSIGPTFRQVTDFMLNYYGILPDYDIK